MFFWRKKKDDKAQADAAVETPLEPPVEYDADIDDGVKAEIEETDGRIVDELESSPLPKHTPLDDAKEAEELKDHSAEGGWLARLAGGLARSTAKMSQGISDIFTKSKLDAAALETLEDLLVADDLGPKTEANIVAVFAEKKDIFHIYLI